MSIFLLASFLWVGHAFSARPHRLTASWFDVPSCTSLYSRSSIDIFVSNFVSFLALSRPVSLAVVAINLLDSANWQSHECAQLIRWQLTHVRHDAGRLQWRLRLWRAWSGGVYLIIVDTCHTQFPPTPPLPRVGRSNRNWNCHSHGKWSERGKSVEEMSPYPPLAIKFQSMHGTGIYEVREIIHV